MKLHNKRLLNKTKLYIGMFLCAIAVLSSPITTLVSFAAESTSVETYADIREWVYKIENDKLYKALLNRSTGQFETDWIYVCDWPPEE